MKNREFTTSKNGFTIVELMIATTVLSIILIVVTAAMINIGNLFYKGFSMSQVQDNTRSITDDVSQHLQLNDQPPIASTPFNPTGLNAYCIGETRYSYTLYKQIGTDIPHVIWKDSTQYSLPTGSCTPANLNSPVPSADPNGVEMITSKSRLTAFSVSLSSPYTVNVGIAFGDSVLLCDSGTPGDCTAQAPSTHIDPPSGLGQILCKDQQGQDFCGTTNLSVTVSQRLTGG